MNLEPPRRVAVLSLFVLATSWPATAMAEPAGCPEVFGEEEDRRANREHRREVLRGIELTRDAVVVYHHAARWVTSPQIRLAGLDLVETSSADGDVHGLLRVSGEGSIRCPEAIYEVSVDDSIGADGQVLAIVPELDLILLEYEGELRFFVPPRSPPPLVSPAWTSMWAINPYRRGPHAAAPYAAKRR